MRWIASNAWAQGWIFSAESLAPNNRCFFLPRCDFGGRRVFNTTEFFVRITHLSVERIVDVRRFFVVWGWIAKRRTLGRKRRWFRNLWITDHRVSCKACGALLAWECRVWCRVFSRGWCVLRWGGWGYWGCVVLFPLGGVLVRSALAKIRRRSS